MKTVYLRGGLCLLAALLFPGRALFAEAGEPERPPFTWSLLWSGSWEEEKNLTQRGDLWLRFPRQDLALRAELLDKQPAEFSWPGEEDSVFARSFDGSGAAVQGGLYHGSTGSRLLYGLLDEWGLPARLRNTWLRSAPFVENRKPTMADLKTAPVSSTDPEAYLYLRSPRLNLPFQGFGYTRFGQSEHPAFGGGLEGQFGKEATFGLEGFYTTWTLPAGKGSAWFSESPLLPERDFQVYGLGFLADTPLFGLSFDWARSETFAWGRDVYGALGLRIGRSGATALGGWQFSLAADGAGPRFIGSDGGSSGAGFRTGAKAEWRGRGRLFRANTTLRSPGLGESFDRFAGDLYYRLPAGQGPLWISRVSLSLDRDARDRERPLDGLGGVLGLGIRPRAFPFLPRLSEFLVGESEAEKFMAGVANSGFWRSPLSLSLSASLKGTPEGTPATAYSLYSAKAGGSIYWSPEFFQFRLGVGYGEQNGAEGLWDFSFSAGVTGKPGRLSFKVASADFPDDWSYTLSWRLEKKAQNIYSTF